MLRYVSIVNEHNERLDLELSNPWTTGLAITNIDGLGAVDADLNFSSLASGYGSSFNSFTVGTRKITISLRVISTNVEATRMMLYKFVRIGARITFYVVTDYKQYLTYGYIKTNSPTIFSEKETISIVIECPSPYFYGINNNDNNNNIVLSGNSGTFEFVWSNESLTQRLTEFSKIAVGKEFKVKYDGTIKTGLVVNIKVNTTLSDFNIQNQYNGSQLELDFTIINRILKNNSILPGDTIEISTIPGSKYAVLNHGSENNISILSAINRNEKWLEIEPGENKFVYRIGSSDNASITLNYQKQYEGI